MRFTGRVAVVTGAASGIGAATAALFAKEGATVVGLDVQDAEGARRCDVSDRDAVRETVAAVVSEHGGIDVLANVAGLVRFGRFEDTTQADW
jgi:NAD(P)-dependent dehydrogenase (short-subunit alcohol dehydrogenase family)